TRKSPCTARHFGRIEVEVARTRLLGAVHGDFRFYTAEMTSRAAERARLESDLRLALPRGELELHYQPIVNLRDETMVGVEALMRWRHPDLGMVPPGDFIPLAEQSDLILHLGAWAL